MPSTMSTHALLPFHYNVLGIREDASMNQISLRYIELAEPYRNGTKSWSDPGWEKIEEAYKVLSDPIKRAEYDEVMGDLTDEVNLEFRRRVTKDRGDIIQNEKNMHDNRGLLAKAIDLVSPHECHGCTARMVRQEYEKHIEVPKPLSVKELRTLSCLRAKYNPYKVANEKKAQAFRVVATRNKILEEARLQYAYVPFIQQDGLKRKWGSSNAEPAFNTTAARAQAQPKNLTRTQPAAPLRAYPSSWDTLSSLPAAPSLFDFSFEPPASFKPRLEAARQNLKDTIADGKAVLANVAAMMEAGMNLPVPPETTDEELAEFDQEMATFPRKFPDAPLDAELAAFEQEIALAKDASEESASRGRLKTANGQEDKDDRPCKKVRLS